MVLLPVRTTVLHQDLQVWFLFLVQLNPETCCHHMLLFICSHIYNTVTTWVVLCFFTMPASICLALLTEMKCLLHSKYLMLFKKKLFYSFFSIQLFKAKQTSPCSYTTTYLPESFFKHQITLQIGHISFINSFKHIQV